MIKTYLQVEDICHKCSKFSPEYSHSILYSDLKCKCHMITITCENRDLCQYLRSYISKGK